MQESLVPDNVLLGNVYIALQQVVWASPLSLGCSGKASECLLKQNTQTKGSQCPNQQPRIPTAEHQIIRSLDSELSLADLALRQVEGPG